MLPYMLCNLIMTVMLGTCEREPTPGILIGADSYKTTSVSPLVGWVQYGIYDAPRGFEIAILEYGKITFLDPTTYAVKRTVAVDDTWIGYKQLVSLNADGNLNLMAGGGGYRDVGWFDLNGHSLWQFRVGETRFPLSLSSLPPNKMIAADLDSDGTKEFYVADNEGVFRLNAGGQVVWRSSSKATNHYLFTLPAEGKRPAAVVTEGGMWDCHGNKLQDGIRSSVGTDLLQPVKWGDAFRLASVKTSSKGDDVFVFDLTGKILFKQSIGAWSVNDVLAVRLKPGEEPHLVVLGTHGPGTDMIKLDIFSHEGILVYREILESVGLQIISNDAARVDTLLLCGKGIKSLKKL